MKLQCSQIQSKLNQTVFETANSLTVQTALIDSTQETVTTNMEAVTGMRGITSLSLQPSGTTVSL